MKDQTSPLTPRGVYPRPCKYRPKYYSKIIQGRKTIWVGTFNTIEEAEIAYLCRKNKLMQDQK